MNERNKESRFPPAVRYQQQAAIPVATSVRENLPRTNTERETRSSVGWHCWMRVILARVRSPKSHGMLVLVLPKHKFATVVVSYPYIIGGAAVFAHFCHCRNFLPIQRNDGLPKGHRTKAGEKGFSRYSKGRSLRRLFLATDQRFRWFLIYYLAGTRMKTVVLMGSFFGNNSI